MLSTAGHDLYMRYTNAAGKSYVQAHRVWDKTLFIETQQRAAEKTNQDQKQGQPRLAKAEQITQEQYAKERKAP